MLPLLPQDGKIWSQENPFSASKRRQARNYIKKLTLLIMIMYVLKILIPHNNNTLRNENMLVSSPRLLEISRNHVFKPPNRIKSLIEKNEIIGDDNLCKIKAGRLTVEKLKKLDTLKKNLSVITLDEILSYFGYFMKELKKELFQRTFLDALEIWEVYRNLTYETLYKWDKEEYLLRMPQRKKDDSLFVSIASYRDENCLNTLLQAFQKAKNPEKLFIGLVQQNCVENCLSGILENGKVIETEPDENCYDAFCSTKVGKPYCESGHIRHLFLEESLSLGPYMARFFASKLWYGEEWFLQIDAHMTFLQDWDFISKQMLKNAPTKRPVISHYPPPHTASLEEKSSLPAARLCGPTFSDDQGEAQIIRLGFTDYYDKKKLKQPRFAPFAGAGLFLAHSDFLKDVPYDPFLPWMFMGEEIIMSARLWTNGYDIYSPTQPVLGHIYVRRNKPKFWETFHRIFKKYTLFDPLCEIVLMRIKSQLNYPESSKDLIKPKSIFTALQDYSIGFKRSLDDFYKYCGLNMTTKTVYNLEWCENGQVPEGFESYAHLYQ